MTDKNEKRASGSPDSELQNIIEAAFFAADEPMGVRKIQALFIEDARPSKDDIEAVVERLQEGYENRGLELVRIGSGWRFQTREKYAPWMRKISANKVPRYSRAQLETLAIIAYRQPVTRGDIEEVRGVAVSSDIIRILEERGWIREIGHRDVPGRPALFGTTQEFLSYFNLTSLRELPELIEERKFEDIAKEMHMSLPPETAAAESSDQSGEHDQTSAEVIPINSAMKEASDLSADEESHDAESSQETPDALASGEHGTSMESDELNSEEFDVENDGEATDEDHDS